MSLSWLLNCLEPIDTFTKKELNRFSFYSVFSLKNFLDHSLPHSGLIHFGISSDKIYFSQQILHASNSQYMQQILGDFALKSSQQMIQDIVFIILKDKIFEDIIIFNLILK